MQISTKLISVCEKKTSGSLDTGQETLLSYFVRHVFTVAENSRHRLAAVLVLEIFHHLVFTFVPTKEQTAINNTHLALNHTNINTDNNNLEDLV